MIGSHTYIVLKLGKRTTTDKPNKDQTLKTLIQTILIKTPVSIL